MLKKYIALLLCILLSSGTLYSQVPRGSGDKELFQEVEKAYKDKDFKACVHKAEDYMTKFPWGPDKIDVLLYNGLSLIQINRINDAIMVFEDLEQSYPDYEKNDKIKYTLGKLYIKKDDKDNARVLLTSLVDRYPKSSYTPQANKLLDQIGRLPKEKVVEKEIDVSDPAYKGAELESRYSFTKITWTKIAGTTSLITAGVFYLMGYTKQQDADNIYDVQYQNAGTEEDAERFFKAADDASEQAAQFKTISLIAACSGVTFLALDYIFFGRIKVLVTPTQQSLNINLKTRF
ncbi:MAG: tetratricopeptide repeat protein [Spirochaetes bacterium]|nr:tetratricopeptide repeat protein [Spirochaetota bacterium]